jgi:Flp pilus assembly protein TadD
MAYAFVNVGDCARTDSLGTVVKTKRERLPAYEAYYLDRVLAWCAGDMNAAYLAAKGMAAVAPHSTYAKYISARSAIPVNHPFEAVDALERLDWRKPHISGYYHDLTVALHKLGRYDRELEVAELYRVRHSGSLIPVEDQVRALSALGRVDAVRRVVAASIAMTSIEQSATSSTVMLMACRELVAHGHREVARGIAHDLIEWLRRREPTADNELTMIRALIATEEFAAALPMAKRLLAEHPDEPRYLTSAGVIAAALGDSAEARHLSAVLQGMQQPRGPADPFYGQAAIDARLGDRTNAVRLLRESVRRGNYGVLIEDSDPFFLSLRGYQPFEELVRPKG